VVQPGRVPGTLTCAVKAFDTTLTTLAGVRPPLGTAFFFALPYHGHIHPCLPVIEELVRRGEQVVAFSTREFQDLFNDVGADFREFPHEHSDTRALVTMAYWQLKVSASSMAPLVRDARDRHADYVLVDASCLWGYALALHLDLPVILLHSTFPSAFQHISHLQSIWMDLRRVPSSLPTVIRFLILDRRFARRWKIPALISPIALAKPRKGRLHVVLADGSMQPGRDNAGYRFVGACIRKRGCTRGEPLPPPDGRPLIYISLGTIWNTRADFYRLCIEAFSDSEYQVLISVGKRVNPESLGPVPEHIHIRQYVDQIAVLERTAVFISHGGMNSLSEAVNARVPLVLIPQANDQFALSNAMEQWGVAIVLSNDSLSVPAIQSATYRAMTDPDIRVRCGTLLDRQQQLLTGACHAANLIVSALQRQSPDSPQSAPLHQVAR